MSTAIDPSFRLYTAYEGRFYAVYQHRFGHLEIVRKSDGASVYLQFENDLVPIRYQLDQADARPDRESAVDRVCAEYDLALKLETE